MWLDAIVRTGWRVIWIVRVPGAKRIVRVGWIGGVGRHLVEARDLNQSRRAFGFATGPQQHQHRRTNYTFIERFSSHGLLLE